LEVATAAAETNARDCQCILPRNIREYKAQAGQDQYLLQRVFFPQDLCCKGVFVEFGARNGIAHSNTYIFERNFGWTGLMFEVDDREYEKLKENRPNADIVLGPVCPSTQSQVTILLSASPGWTGTTELIEPTRNGTKHVRSHKKFQCHHLAKELKARNMHRIDYMTIDTEGSEPDIVEDFPWNDFDVRVVQVEQLVASRYPAQKGKKERVVAHMEKFGYRLLSIYPVAVRDTDDLIFTRNVDAFLNMTTRVKDPGM